MTRAARLAEACFALARSTTFAGERDAAISRGKAIVDAAGLLLDDFDIPGRSRRAPASSNPHRSTRPTDWTAFSAAMERAVDAMRGTAERMPRSAGPTGYTVETVRELSAGLRAHLGGSRDALSSLYATMARREAEVGATDGESVYDARRRNFDEAARW